MSILLFIVGAIAFVGGVVLAGFGIPSSEFSFGNTLIVAGATVGIGGLVLIGLGAVVSQLKRIAEGPASPMPERAARPAETFEPMPSPAPEPIPAPGPARATPAAAPEGGRFPFPTRRKREPAAKEHDLAHPELPRFGEPVAERPVTPRLRNPDVPPVAVDDEVSLSPHEPPAPAPRDLDEPTQGESTEENVGVSAMRRGPIRESGWRSAPPPVSPVPPPPGWRPTYFDTMWPAEGRPSRGPAAAEPNADDVPEVKPEPAFEPELPPEPTFESPPHEAAEPAAPIPSSDDEPRRTVEVLKSGVVDGMGYTLYVDGSIEAELPQGTLRFASITELRAHLEKNS
jgi:hypothetical protein